MVFINIMLILNRKANWCPVFPPFGEVSTLEEERKCMCKSKELTEENKSDVHAITLNTDSAVVMAVSIVSVLG